MKRSLAVVGVGALVATGFAAVVAPSAAQAATSVNTNAWQCQTAVFYQSDDVQVINTAAMTQPDYTLTLNANGVTPGNDITVTGSYSPNQFNGPVGLNNFVSQQRLSLAYTVNGGAPIAIDGPLGASSAPVNVAGGSPGGALPNVAPGAITIDGSTFVDGDEIEIFPTAFILELTSTSLGGVYGSTTCVPADPIGDAPNVPLAVNVLNAASASISAVAGQSNPAYARAGQVATLTGSDWGPSAGDTFTVQHCNAAGASCGAPQAAPGLSVATDTLAGNYTIPTSFAAGVGTGARSITVTAAPSGQSVNIPINILSTRTGSISPAQGGANTVVTVEVANFDTGSDVIAFGSNAGSLIPAGGPGCAPGCNILVPTNSLDEGAVTTVSATGTASPTVTITDSSTNLVAASQGATIPAFGPSAPVAVMEFGGTSLTNFTYGANSCDVDPDPANDPGEIGGDGSGSSDAGCYTIQFLDLEVEAGLLSLSQDDADVNDLGFVTFRPLVASGGAFEVELDPITGDPVDGDLVTPGVQPIPVEALQLNGSTRFAGASLDDLTVVDARGTNASWSLWGSVTDFVNGDVTTGNNTIPATNLAWDPTCDIAAGTGTVDGVTPVAAGAFVAGAPGNGADVPGDAEASKGLCNKATGAGGGTWTADADLELTVPADVAIGNYKATLYLSIA
jgi:hypothetical protein